MRTVAIVQARLGSSRLPGKVLKDLCGKPMLEHVVERLKTAKSLDEVVVAIPEGAKDAPLAEWCRKKGYALFAGSENDLLSRYVLAARAFKADVVVRITSDCPLIDPALVDTVVDAHARSAGNDYTCNVLLRTFPRGVDTEVISRECLERINREAKDPLYREHVTNLVHDRPGDFRLGNVARPQGDRSDLRICIDTEEDFALVEGVLRGLGEKGDRAGIEEVIGYLDTRPDLARLNAGVKQKPKSLGSAAP